MTKNDGECPVCHRIVWSSFNTAKSGLDMHIAVHHQDYALEKGIAKHDKNGWVIVPGTEELTE